jgi:hypothetical protein
MTDETIIEIEEQEPMPEIKFKLCNDADSATLNFFSNPHYLGKLNKKLNPINKPDNKINVKFYKKRIISLFKDIIKDDEAPTEEIKDIYNRFVDTMINYFEIIDKKDIIQGMHGINEQLPSDNLEDKMPESITIDQANELMIKKTIQVANLNNYVIAKHDTTTNDLRIIPLKIEYDLKTPDLKTKGVKPKKIKKSINKEEDLSQ